MPKVVNPNANPNGNNKKLSWCWQQARHV